MFGKKSEPYEIRSKFEPTKCLAVILFEPYTNSRVELTRDDQNLQVSLVPLGMGKTIPAHRHNPVRRETVGTHEVWIVISGSIEIQIMDLDNTIMGKWVLERGSISVLQSGGHSLTAREPNTLIYELKNGPYWGPSVDKLYI
jgi:hypothetical protein